MKMENLTPEEQEIILSLRKEKELKAWKPMDKNLISAETKVEAFDRIYHLAEEIFNTYVDSGSCGKDDKHYAFEAVMNLLGDSQDVDIWKVISYHCRRSE